MLWADGTGHAVNGTQRASGFFCSTQARLGLEPLTVFIDQRTHCSGGFTNVGGGLHDVVIHLLSRCIENLISGSMVSAGQTLTISDSFSPLPH